MASIPDLSGTWKLASSENMDQFLKACGVGMVHRGMAAKISPTVHIKQTGSDQFVIVTKTTVRTQELKFKVNEVFRSTVPWEKGDQEMIASWEGDSRLVVRMVGDSDGSQPTFSRYLDGDGRLVLVQAKKDIVAKRYFQRVDKS